ncbi:GntR family transcriptional repressor for pyruvate dehydrogenase complex [Microbacterium resistens]|uniref:GntR family transcriptional repressor for pyruvate dehydrogenase complex n=1 Tax=Microbacterium resistens TaxID=156977 RepID=A0ABU1S7V2_9MICO|nr:FCD domain-containing protein [Microbacterium resistens]MDR6865679.1 GntR family transcriptional repressor for pyruvate dehydrogenase complex [Microbacterium resistens]
MDSTYDASACRAIARRRVNIPETVYDQRVEDLLADALAATGPLPGAASHEAVAEVLKRRILLGGFSTDDRLPTERELAEVLEVSRNTVRRAVRQLAAEGVVETTLGRTGGTRVVARRLDDGAERATAVASFQRALDAHTEYRSLIEPPAAELAALRASDADRAAIDAALSMRADDLASYHRADTLIHLSIARASGNPMLAEAVTAARAQMFSDTNVLWLHAEWHDVYGDGEQLETVLRRDHEPIVEAIRRSDADGARTEMLAHLRESHGQFTRLLDGMRSSSEG